MCDEEKLVCNRDNTGISKPACDNACAHHTPDNLLGNWRGLNVKDHMNGNFMLGEFDMIFGDANLTVMFPNKTQKIFDVATTPDALILIDPLTQEKTKVIVNELSYLRHTYAMAFSFKGPGMLPPASFR